MSSCSPFPMRAGSSQGIPLGNGCGTPGLRGQWRSWRKESLGASAGLQPGAQAQLLGSGARACGVRVQATSGTGSQARWGGTATLRAQGRQHSSGLAQGVRCGCRRGPRDGGSRQDSAPWAQGAAARTASHCAGAAATGALGSGSPGAGAPAPGGGGGGRQAAPPAGSALGKSLAAIPGGLYH